MLDDAFTSKKDINEHEENEKIFFLHCKIQQGLEHNMNSQNSDFWSELPKFLC